MADKSDLPMLAVKRLLLVGVLNLLIVIAGLAAFAGIEVRELPNVDRPIVSVTASLPGAAPETMDSEVTSVLEDAVARVTGVRQINSSSEENNSRIRAEFNPGVDLDTAASDVREAVSRVTRDLPDRVEQVNIIKADADAQPIMILAVSSDRYGEAELTRVVENDVIPELLTAEGVASIDQFGTRALQMRVSVDPARLNRFGLTMSDAATALEGAPYDVPVESFRSESQELVVRADASATDPDLIREVIVTGTTRVGDVAEVTLAPADATNFVRLDGRPIVGLGVVRQASSNTIQISNAIRASVDRVAARYQDLDISVVSDDADFIEVSVREVLITLAFTILVVVGTMLLFFRAWRPTMIPSTTIPVALIGVLAGIWLMGFSINLLTLLALVLATGLIVDDAIVVLENTQRLRNKGLGRHAAGVLRRDSDDRGAGVGVPADQFPALAGGAAVPRIRLRPVGCGADLLLRVVELSLLLGDVGLQRLDLLEGVVLLLLQVGDLLLRLELGLLRKDARLTVLLLHPELRQAGAADAHLPDGIGIALRDGDGELLMLGLQHHLDAMEGEEAEAARSAPLSYA